jgi:hypothetical protein
VATPPIVLKIPLALETMFNEEGKEGMREEIFLLLINFFSVFSKIFISRNLLEMVNSTMVLAVVAVAVVFPEGDWSGKGGKCWSSKNSFRHILETMTTMSYSMCPSVLSLYQLCLQ